MLSMQISLTQRVSLAKYNPVITTFDIISFSRFKGHHNICDCWIRSDWNGDRCIHFSTKDSTNQ